MEKFRNFLILKGIHYPSNGILFISTETNYLDLKKIVNNINIGLSKYFKWP